jgi:hypothetical protein
VICYLAAFGKLDVQLVVMLSATQITEGWCFVVWKIRGKENPWIPKRPALLVWPVLHYNIPNWNPSL